MKMAKEAMKKQFDKNRQRSSRDITYWADELKGKKGDGD